LELAVYPNMSKRLVDLHDHDSVVANLAIMKLSFSLPTEGPNPFFKRPLRGALRSDRPKQPRMSLRASVSSDRSAQRSCPVGLNNPTKAT
jgi:hypothetical protein